jgi:signal transduction histidine kinase
MSNDSPGNLQVMRTAAWTWGSYLVALAAVDLVIYAGGSLTPILWYEGLNAVPAVLFLALTYSPWARSRPRILTPLLILLVSGAPVLIYHVLGLRLPPAPLSNLEGMILRQLPLLLIGLILVAWHYNLATMLLFSFGTNLLELVMVLGMERLNNESLTAFYFITIIRTVCFLVVGIFINLLITYLRAQQASLQLANAQLRHYASTQESLTVSRERNRMSRELHDTVVHTLSGLSVQLETASAYWEVEPATARRLLDQSLDATRLGVQETRLALKALRASPLEDLGLVLALQQLTAAAAERAKLRLDVSLPDKTLSLPPDVEQCLYRITQEAVENVVHHANAQHLVVKLTMQPDEILLVIQDDGIGFNPEARMPAGHFGLKGMQERAVLAGGRLSITSHPAQGTIIRLALKGNYA